MASLTCNVRCNSCVGWGLFFAAAQLGRQSSPADPQPVPSRLASQALSALLTFFPLCLVWCGAGFPCSMASGSLDVAVVVTCTSSAQLSENHSFCLLSLLPLILSLLLATNLSFDLFLALHLNSLTDSHYFQLIPISPSSSLRGGTMPLSQFDHNLAGRSSRASDMSAISDLSKTASRRTSTDRDIYNAPGVMSMLRASTETGDVGSVTMPSTRMPAIPRPAHRRSGTQRSAGSSVHSASASQTSRSYRPVNPHPHPQGMLRGPPRGLHPPPLFFSSPTHHNPSRGLPMPPRVAGGEVRSYSMTHTSRPLHGLPTQRSLTSLRSQGLPDRSMNFSPQSAYRYPHGARRSHQRTVSPTFSDVSGHYPYANYRMDAMRSHNGRRAGNLSPPPIHPADLAQLPRGPQPMRFVSAPHERDRLPLPRLQPDYMSSSPPPSPLPPTPRDPGQVGSVVVGMPSSPLHYDNSILTSPTTYYDYTEEFSTTDQSGGDDAPGLAAGFVHRIRTIMEEKAGQEEAKRKQLQQEPQQADEPSESDTIPDASEIAATCELPDSSPTSNRITRDMVAAALETSFDDTDETKGPNTSTSTAGERSRKKAHKASISTQGSLAGSASLLHSSFIQDEKSDKQEDSSTELKDSTFTDGPSSVWDGDTPSQGSGDLTVRFSLPPLASQMPTTGQEISSSIATGVLDSGKPGKDSLKGNSAAKQPAEKRSSATITINAPQETTAYHKLTPSKRLAAHSDSMPSTPTTTVKLAAPTPQNNKSASERDALNRTEVEIHVAKPAQIEKPLSKYSGDDASSQGSPGTAIIGETSFSTHTSDVATSKKPIIKIFEDTVKPAEPAQNGGRTMTEFFNARRSQTRPFSAMNESETFKRLSQGCSHDDHLSDVKEESREDLSTTDLSSFKFPMPWHANRKLPKSRPRSRSDVSPVARNNSSRQSTRPNMPKPLAETRTIPSLNFSRLDLISKLNEALEARDRTSQSLDTRRSKTYNGIHAPVPERALSPCAMRERYKSFFAAEDDSDNTLDEEQMADESGSSGRNGSGSSGGPKLKRTVSPVELIHELDRLSIPSVNPLTARLSRLMPSLRNHKSWEHVLDDDEGLTQTIEDIRQLGDRRTPNKSSPVNPDEMGAGAPGSLSDVSQKPRSPSISSAPNLMKDLPPLPASKDGNGRSQEGLRLRNSAVKSVGSVATFEALAVAMNKQRSKAELPEISVSPHEQMIPRSSYRSLRHRSSPFNRPWNLEESYPWDDSVPPIDIALPLPTHPWEHSSSRPSRLRQHGSISTTASELELLPSPVRKALVPRGPETPKPPQNSSAGEQGNSEQHQIKPSKGGLLGSLKMKIFGVPSTTKKIVKRNISTPNFRHQSPLSSHPVMAHVDGFAALPTVLSVSDHHLTPDQVPVQKEPSHSPVNPGDRYPTSALSPPSAFNLSEVRSFFSDDSSINGEGRKNRRDRPSLGKRLTTHLRSRVRSPSGNALKLDVPPVPKIDLKSKSSQPTTLPTPTSATNRRTKSADDCRTPRQSPHDVMQRATTSPDFGTGANSPERQTKELARVTSKLDRQDHAPKQSQEGNRAASPPARSTTPTPTSPSRTHKLVERLRQLWLKSSGFFRHLGNSNGKRSQKREEDREWSAGTDIEVSIEELPNTRLAEAQDKQTNKKESIEPEGAWGKVVKKVVEGSVSVSAEGSGRDSRADTSRDSRAHTPKGDRGELRIELHGDKTPTQSAYTRLSHAAIRPATAP